MDFMMINSKALLFVFSDKEALLLYKDKYPIASFINIIKNPTVGVKVKLRLLVDKIIIEIRRV